jgi:hypothetical protein
MDKEFRNNASRAERRRQHAEDVRRLRSPPEPTTLRDLAQVDEFLGNQGRFSEQARVTGAEIPP